MQKTEPPWQFRFSLELNEVPDKDGHNPLILSGIFYKIQCCAAPAQSGIRGGITGKLPVFGICP